jgi:16S rRNA (cytosine967-C5)-methyltransferase
MPDQSVLNQAALVLAAVAEGQRADLALHDYLAGRRHGSWRERRGIAGAVFAYFRWFQWLEHQVAPQGQLAHALALRDRFAADENSVKTETLAARAVPRWLGQEMELPEAYLRQLQREPTLWVRARPGTRDKLAADLGDCEPTDRAPDALAYHGERDLFQTAAFKAGAFEIQDLASQIVGTVCDPKPGETWWDACAGEGGKMLHLADLMGNKGVVWATDRSTRRLDTLRRRAARAKLFNFRAVEWGGGVRLPNKVRFDGVLVDAPCSGVGTWQRNPHARWTTTENDVRELAGIQRGLLDNVCGSVRPGGRLVYSVCTLTRSETAAVADAFTAGHPEFEPIPSILLLPQEIRANGMFVASWRKRAGAGPSAEAPTQAADPAAG